MISRKVTASAFFTGLVLVAFAGGTNACGSDDESPGGESTSGAGGVAGASGSAGKAGSTAGTAGTAGAGAGGTSAGASGTGGAAGSAAGTAGTGGASGVGGAAGEAGAAGQGGTACDPTEKPVTADAIFVSTDGNATNDGSIDAPVTLPKAL
jgi:hypothetical protein